MYPHRIRLVGPWEAQPLVDREADNLPPARRVVVPVRREVLGFAHDAGVLFRRRFGLPRKLDDWERVWVVPSRDSDAAFAWQLNGTDLHWIHRPEERANFVVPPRADVTANLRDRNMLTVRVAQVDLESAPFGGAALEIGCRAFIRTVRLNQYRVAHGFGAMLTVDVVSEYADDPLELYALVDGATRGYVKLWNHKGETTRRVHLDDEVFFPATTATLRVDLVNVATIWDTAEMPITVPG